MNTSFDWPKDENGTGTSAGNCLMGRAPETMEFSSSSHIPWYSTGSFHVIIERLAKILLTRTNNAVGRFLSHVSYFLLKEDLQ